MVPWAGVEPAWSFLRQILLTTIVFTTKQEGIDPQTSYQIPFGGMGAESRL